MGLPSKTLLEIIYLYDTNEVFWSDYSFCVRDRKTVGVLQLREWHDIQGLSLDVLLFSPLCSWPLT